MGGRNRIVVNYGDMEDLVLLSVIDNKTGIDMSHDNIVKEYSDVFTIVKRYDGLTDLSTLRDIQDDNREGYVLRFSNGFRVKAKFEEYCRLHMILTNISNKVIWRKLRNNEPMDEILEKVPDEFYNWVKTTVKDLELAYAEIEIESLRNFKNIIFELINNDFDKKFFTTKEFAKIANEYKDRGIIFSMYRGRDYSDRIWRDIEPKWSLPFMDEDE
jgi:RNA ligase